MAPDPSETSRIAELHSLVEARGWRLRLDLDRDGTAIAWLRHRTVDGRSHEVRGPSPIEAAEAAWRLFCELEPGGAKP